MATIREEILDAALQDNLIFRPFSVREKLYISPSVVSLNEIYFVLKIGDFSLEEIAFKTGLNKNTVAIMLRYLEKHGIVRVFRKEIEGENGARLANLYSIKERGFK